MGIPPTEWIGFKFIVKTLPDEGSVLLELYLDLTDGKNGGEWKKVLEYKDKGQWYAEAEDGICNDYPHNKILFAPGFVRNDFIGQADQYKGDYVGAGAALYFPRYHPFVLFFLQDILCLK